MADDANRYVKVLDALRDAGAINDETCRRAVKWMTDPDYAEFRGGVVDLLRPTPLIDAFYQIIPFGTGGRRGLVGVGSNRMNARTIGESAQGLAAYIKSQDRDGSYARRGVVVACDVRLSSAEFARITAETLAAAGLHVYLFDGPRATPLLSFAVRNLHAIAGAVITASHNPPSDNGFKAYWEDGGQMVAPHDGAVLEEVARVAKIGRLPLKEAIEKGLVEILDDRVDRAYVAMSCRDLPLCDERDVTIVYSPLHGTGVTVVPPVLAALGFKDVRLPPQQAAMDGHFPTVPRNYPNPEMPAVLDIAIALAKEIGGDLAIASDPDADRLGVAAPDGRGNFAHLTGNEVQALLLDFVLTRRRERGALPADAYVLTTQVTTRMLRRIAAAHGVEIVDDLLVGFKNIAAEIHRREMAGQPPTSMVMACEESIGYMLTAEVRDKDSGAGAAGVAQLAAYWKARGKTLLQAQAELWAKFGYFVDRQFSVFLEGEAGAEQMRKLMDDLRREPPRSIAGLATTAVVDRETDTHWDLKTGVKKPLGLERSNVLAFVLGDDGLSSVTIRPSGTEPKIKHYIAHHGDFAARAQVDQDAARVEADMKRIEQELLK
jgi:phosphomannomutase